MKGPFSLNSAVLKLHDVLSAQKRTILIVPTGFNALPANTLKYLDTSPINERTAALFAFNGNENDFKVIAVNEFLWKYVEFQNVEKIVKILPEGQLPLRNALPNTDEMKYLDAVTRHGKLNRDEPIEYSQIEWK